MVLLTVSGMIGKTNRGPLDPKRDSMLALQKMDFKNAFAFDRAMLLALPQGTVTVNRRNSTSPPASAARYFAKCSVIWRRGRPERVRGDERLYRLARSG